jgi:uncharacterized protein (UPF0548 family)
MQILFSRKGADLASWERRGFAPAVLAGPRPGDNRDRHAADVGVEVPGNPAPDGPFRRVASAILAYRIFPPRLAETALRRTPVEVGDTLGLRYRLFPGISLFIASRVIDVFDGPANGVWRCGFTYHTLEGHAMIGEETFAVERDLATGKVTASLESWSRPRHWLTRVGYWYARWCQLHAGRAAVRFLRSLAAEAH